MKKKTKHEIFCAFFPLILLIFLLIGLVLLIVYGIKKMFHRLKSEIAYIGLDSGQSRSLSILAKHRQRAWQAKEMLSHLFYDGYESIDCLCEMAELDEVIKNETSLSEKLAQSCKILKIPNWRIKAV